MLLFIDYAHVRFFALPTGLTPPRSAQNDSIEIAVRSAGQRGPLRSGVSLTDKRAYSSTPAAAKSAMRSVS